MDAEDAIVYLECLGFVMIPNYYVWELEFIRVRILDCGSNTCFLNDESHLVGLLNHAPNGLYLNTHDGKFLRRIEMHNVNYIVDYVKEHCIKEAKNCLATAKCSLHAFGFFRNGNFCNRYYHQTLKEDIEKMLASVKNLKIVSGIKHDSTKSFFSF